MEKAKERTEESENIDYLQMDLTEEKEASHLTTHISDRGEDLDGLVNLVGGFSMGGIQDIDGEKLTTSFERQVLTVFLAIKYTAEFLRKGDGGSVVNFSSRRALDSKPGSLSYNIAKTGVASLTKSLNEELEKVRVNALAPETMDTQANRKAMPDADREEWTSPSKVAEVVEFLLSSKSSSIGGQIITV